MQFASLIAIALLTLLPGHTSLSGTWALDRLRSDFGKAAAPGRFVMQLEQIGDHLAATIFTDDANGQRVSYRECRIEVEPGTALLCLMPSDADEAWHVMAGSELTITRVIATRSQPIRQRLLLVRSTLLE